MSTPISTARRALAWRVEALLRVQEALPVPTLTGWQADAVEAAIEALDEERFADGESIMMKAERPDLWARPDYVADQPKDVATLLVLLKNAMPA